MADASAPSGPAAVTQQELVATVARMESRLAEVPSPKVAQLLALYRGLVPRFQADLGACSRDVALARASALMLVQAAAQAEESP
jgi:hypothetical protein